MKIGIGRKWLVPIFLLLRHYFDDSDVIDLILNRHDCSDFANECPILFANFEPTTDSPM